MRTWSLLVTLSLYGLCGCSSEESFEVAPVSGLVTIAGQPVSHGTIQFAPIAASTDNKPGKTGTGEIQPDGTFTISTFEEGDGAVIGKVKITAGPSDPAQPWKHTLQTPVEFEVSPSGNQLILDIQPDGTAKVTASKS